MLRFVILLAAVLALHDPSATRAQRAPTVAQLGGQLRGSDYPYRRVPCS